jgi:hypothetical protein
MWRLTLSERPTYPQWSLGHLTMAWQPWRLDDFNDAWLKGGFFIVNLSVDVSLLLKIPLQESL